MQRVARRDHEAFADLVERYAGRLFAVARRLLGSREDAEDAVQRAFLRCYTRAGSYRPEWAVSTWIYRVLTNICVDELRRRASRDPQAGQQAPPPEGGRTSGGPRGRPLDPSARVLDPPGRHFDPPDRHFDPPGRHFDPPGRFLDLHRAMDRVPEQARVLLALRYVDGLSYAELARVRGVSENTVKSQLARGKAILRAALGVRSTLGARAALGAGTARAGAGAGAAPNDARVRRAVAGGPEPIATADDQSRKATQGANR
jgi:RNA polymerase sigma-70 factor (ECF subfamily)